SDKRLPVNYEEELRRELAELRTRVEPPKSNTISTNGKLFTLPTGQTSPGPLRAIILDFVASNVLYKGVYTRNVKQPALCFSIDKQVANMVPSENSPQPMSTNCKACPK